MLSLLLRSRFPLCLPLSLGPSSLSLEPLPLSLERQPLPLTSMSLYLEPLCLELLPFSLSLALLRALLEAEVLSLPLESSRRRFS
eukprot:7669788-Pyramimonas_sp.AAC.1